MYLSTHSVFIYGYSFSRHEVVEMAKAWAKEKQVGKRGYNQADALYDISVTSGLLDWGLTDDLFMSKDPVIFVIPVATNIRGSHTRDLPPVDVMRAVIDGINKWYRLAFGKEYEDDMKWIECKVDEISFLRKRKDKRHGSGKPPHAPPPPPRTHIYGYSFSRHEVVEMAKAWAKEVGKRGYNQADALYDISVTSGLLDWGLTDDVLMSKDPVIFVIPMATNIKGSHTCDLPPVDVMRAVIDGINKWYRLAFGKGYEDDMKWIDCNDEEDIVFLRKRKDKRHGSGKPPALKD